MSTRSTRQRSSDAQALDAEPDAKRTKSSSSLSAPSPSPSSPIGVMSSVDKNLNLSDGTASSCVLLLLKVASAFIPIDQGVQDSILKSELKVDGKQKIFITPNPTGSSLMYESDLLEKWRDASGAAIADKNIPTYEMDPLDLQLPIGGSRKFNAFAPNPTKFMFFFTHLIDEKLANKFELGNISELKSMLSPINPTLSISFMPSCIEKICNGKVYITDLVYSMFRSDLPCLSFNAEFVFSKDSALAKALSIDKIKMIFKITFGDEECALDISMSIDITLGGDYTISCLGKKDTTTWTFNGAIAVSLETLIHLL